jgi:hypothetical protein
MENLHPLVIGIRSEENYNKLKYIIGGIGIISSGIIGAEQYGKTLEGNRRNDKHMSQTYINQKNQNTIQLLGLLPRITIPKGTLIFHSNKFTSLMLENESEEMQTKKGWYPKNNRCQTCQLRHVPYERVGESPRMNELLFNPNSWNYTTNSCQCLEIKQHRLFGNFNFTGNYNINVKSQMRGTHAYIVNQDIHILDATYISIELGFSIKNFSDIGDMQVVKQYCVENLLDGITMFDTADPQENVEIASDDVIRGANNSCYKHKWIDPHTGIEKTSYICPEIVLFHNNNDSEWENLRERYPEVTNIGTRKIKIMGMVDLIHNERKLPRDKISNMFDILFSNYLTYVPQYNQEQVNMRTGKQIGEITIGYANTNIYKMIVHNNGSEEDQNILFELITLAWSNMIQNRGLYCITGDFPIDRAPNLKFFDADQNAEVLVDIPHLSNPHHWIKLYSRINIDFDLESRLQRSPLYSSESIFQRILSAHNITPENIYKLYIISCLTIIPEIRQNLRYDIIDVLEGTVGEQQIQDFYNYCINNVIKEQCAQYFQQRNDFIFSKFNIPFVLNTQEFYSRIQLINIDNSIPTFIFTKNIISFINTESESFKTLRAYLLDPLIQVYNNKLVEFFSFFSNQIMVIINSHFQQEMIQNSDVQNLLVLFTQKFTQDRFQEFMTKIFNSYKILEYRLFMEDIDHMIIDLIKFFWDIFTEYMTTTKMVTINGIPTKEYMDNLFTTSQRTLYPASSFYEVLTTDVDMNAYSPLYYHSSNKNVVYVYLENEIIDINGLWEYYHKNKDSDILDLIYELKELERST